VLIRGIDEGSFSVEEDCSKGHGVTTGERMDSSNLPHSRALPAQARCEESGTEIRIVSLQLRGAAGIDTAPNEYWDRPVEARLGILTSGEARLSGIVSAMSAPGSGEAAATVREKCKLGLQGEKIS
jgi:hypothetical protein